MFFIKETSISFIHTDFHHPVFHAKSKWVAFAKLTTTSFHFSFFHINKSNGFFNSGLSSNK